MSRHQKTFEEHQHARFMRPDAGRWLRPDAERWLRPDIARFFKSGSFVGDAFPGLQRTEMKYSPDQPRDDRGRWTDGDVFGAEANSAADDATQLANVIRVCILSGVARTTGYLGRQYTAFYDCANGLSVKQTGWGHRVPGLILDPH